MNQDRCWTINGDFTTLRPTGVARYAREVVLALDDLFCEEHPLTLGVSLDLIAPREPRDLLLKKIPVRIVQEFDTPRLPQFWVQAQLPRHVCGGLLSFCNLAPLFRQRHIACIHDLHTYIMPESYGILFRLAHKLILPRIGHHADFVTTVSDFSAKKLTEFGIAPAEKIVVTYNGSDHADRWDAAKSSIQLGDRPYVFCLGQKQKYKNMELIYRIAAPLADLGLEILVAGDANEDEMRRQTGEPVPNLRVLGRISDDDMAKALSRSLCFLFPSRIEGFGLPAIEAMRRGSPVVASTSACLPEICGEAAMFAGPDDPGAWISAIGQLKSDPEFRQSMIEQGKQRAQQYTWRGIANIYLRLMSQVDSK